MRKKILWTTLLMALLVNIAVFATVSAPTVPYVALEPPMVSGVFVPGETFQLELTVDYVEKLWAYQFELGEAALQIPGWDPSVIHLVSVENGPFLGSRGGRVVFFSGTIDNTVGTLSLTGAALDPNLRWPTGGGTLAILTFEVVGSGETPITLGLDTGLLSPSGTWIMRGTSNPDHLLNSYFINSLAGPMPELYIRTRGAHGGGIWPEWQVNLEGVEQTLYCKIMNYGDGEAEVFVRMTIDGKVFGVEERDTNVDTVPAATWVADDIVPGEVTVSVTFPPPGIDRYTVNGVLWFKVAGMPGFVPYTIVIPYFGGEGESRDIAATYKVVSKM